MVKISLSKKGIGFVLAILSALLWGTNGTFCALLSKLGLSTVNIAVLAPVFNFFFFFFVLLFSNRTGFRVGWKILLLMIVDGIMADVVNISFIKSVNYFPVGIVSTLVFCNIFTIMIMSKIVFKSKITLQKVLAAIAAVFGVSLVLNVFKQGFSLNYNGLLWIFLTILAWSSMVTLEKYALDKGVDSNAILMYTALFAGLFLSIFTPPWTLAGNIARISSQTGGLALLVVLGFGMIPQVGSYFLYINGLKFIEPSYVQIAYSLDPVTASILGLIVFKQTMNTAQIIGILLILIVVGYVQFRENQEGGIPN